jgi:transposase
MITSLTRTTRGTQESPIHCIVPDVKMERTSGLALSVELETLQRVAMRMGCMASWTDESLLYRPPSEDSGRPRARHAQGQKAARTFAVGISTLKRYASKAQRGEPLEPGKAPGRRPKMDEPVGKLLEEDLKERPFVTLRERCDYVEAISGVSVSRSTMCRAISRIGSTRKKGDEAPQSEMSS